MSVTFGFYNSLNGDRKYNAEQMASIFDGIIEDGIYQSIGGAFIVKATTGNNITVETGRAWFNHTWTLNDAVLPLTADQSEVLLNRYDAIVIEVNNDPATRKNEIKIIKGTPSSTPVKPTMANSTYLHQYPLAYILRTAGATAITTANITNTVGTSECPFVIGVLRTLTIDNFMAQWGAQWNEWFDRMKGQLSTDAAGNLQNQIDDVKKTAVNSRISNCILERPSNMSYSGLSITIPSGTKVLIPNGKNPDGTLKSIEATLTANKTIQNVTNGDRTIYVNAAFSTQMPMTARYYEVENFVNLPATVADTNQNVAYVRNENKAYATSGSTTATWTLFEFTPIANYSASTTAVSGLYQYRVFRIADYNDFVKFKSNFQDGLNTIASAITSNGVSTASNASPATMSTNIGNIRSGGTLDSAGNQLLAGYNAYSGKVLRAGSMPNRGAWSATINPGENVAIPYGYHGGGTVSANGASLQLLHSGAPNGTITFGRAYKYVIFSLTAKRDVAFGTGITVVGNWSWDMDYSTTDSNDMYVRTLHMWDVTTSHSIGFSANTQDWNARAIAYGIY